MNFIDRWILITFNSFSRHSYVFDKGIAYLSYFQPLKGGVLIAICWWAWFRPEAVVKRYREHVVATLFACFVAMATARLVAVVAPFRLRPIHDQAFKFLVPFGASTETLDGWSSFPSDHATLFFALATGLMFVSKRVGQFCIAYTTIVILLPRIYLGLHYPSDILAGAMLGGIFASLANVYLIENRAIKTIVAWSSEKPSLFYPCFFIVSYEFVEMFGHVRKIASELKILL